MADDLTVSVTVVALEEKLSKVREEMRDLQQQVLDVLNNDPQYPIQSPNSDDTTTTLEGLNKQVERLLQLQHQITIAIQHTRHRPHGGGSMAPRASSGSSRGSQAAPEMSRGSRAAPEMDHSHSIHRGGNDYRDDVPHEDDEDPEYLPPTARLPEPVFSQMQNPRNQHALPLPRRQGRRSSGNRRLVEEEPRHYRDSDFTPRERPIESYEEKKERVQREKEDHRELLRRHRADMKRREEALHRQHMREQRQKGRLGIGGEEFRGQYKGAAQEDVEGEQSRRVALERVRKYRDAERKHKIPGRKDVNLTQEQHQHYLRLKAMEAARRMDDLIELTPREGEDPGAPPEGQNVFEDAKRIWEESKLDATPRRRVSNEVPRIRTLEEIAKEGRQIITSREEERNPVTRHSNGRRSMLENEGEFEKWDEHGRRAGRMEKTEQIAARLHQRAAEVQHTQEQQLDELETRVLDRLKQKRDAVEHHGAKPLAKPRPPPRHSSREGDWEVTPRMRQPREQQLPPGFS